MTSMRSSNICFRGRLSYRFCRLAGRKPLRRRSRTWRRGSRRWTRSSSRCSRKRSYSSWISTWRIRRPPLTTVIRWMQMTSRWMLMKRGLWLRGNGEYPNLSSIIWSKRMTTFSNQSTLGLSQRETHQTWRALILNSQMIGLKQHPWTIDFSREPQPWLWLRVPTREPVLSFPKLGP
jgi:hypothetical protein